MELPAECPCCRLGSTQLPFSRILQPASGAGKAGALLGSVVIRKDRNLVIGSERALNGAQGVVHLGHHVGGQALVDDKGDGEREWIHGEEAQRLARIVLIDFEVAEGEASDQLSLGVLDGDRDFDEVDVHNEMRDC
jgi:hypothetical protein